MFSALEQLLISYVSVFPLEVFAFVASFIEEVIAPIPSPTVMVITGTFAAIQGRLLLGLVPLILFATVGKTIGAVIVYYIADKGEDIILKKFGRFLGISHEEVESFGKKLTGGMRDYAVLTFLRALPIMPSAIVSVGSGLLKVPLRMFVISTFIGTIFRDSFYLYAGYVGAKALTSLIETSSTIESNVESAAIVLILVAVGYLFYRKRKKLVAAVHRDTPEV